MALFGVYKTKTYVSIFLFRNMILGCNESKAIYLHHALENGWGLESNSVESWWFDQKSLWNQLHGDTESSSSCQLSFKEDLFLGPPLFRGRTTTGIQIVPSNAGNLNITESD